MAYALGLLYSDGCLRQGHSGSWRVVFTNTDLSTLKWLHQWMGNPGKVTRIPAGLQKTDPSWKVHIAEAKKDRYQTTVSSDTIGNRLLELGLIPRKSTKQEAPLPRVPESYYSSFVRGLFDGDGGIWFGTNSKMPGGKNLCISLTCSPKGARRDLIDLLDQFGLSCSQSGISLQLRGSNAEALCTWVYSSPGPRMDTKFKTWQDWSVFRKKVAGGLIQENMYRHDRTACKGLQPRDWHSLIGVLPVSEIVMQTGVSRSRVYQVRKVLCDGNRV